MTLICLGQKRLVNVNLQNTFADHSHLNSMCALSLNINSGDMIISHYLYVSVFLKEYLDINSFMDDYGALKVYENTRKIKLSNFF